MSSEIKANVSRMFKGVEPWAVSASQFELGPNAARITWSNARSIAYRCEEWLITPLSEACALMRQWARHTGAWDREEIESWDAHGCLALFAQNIASELRSLGADEVAELCECAEVDQEDGTLCGFYTVEWGELMVTWYAGM